MHVKCFAADEGSVWIGLILLKLKTYCWNHCSKIIFKCVNSIVRPIFNEKVAKKWNLWIHKQYIMHCLQQKSQHLRLLFIEQYLNSNRVLPKRVKKKKKRKTQLLKTQTCYPNRGEMKVLHFFFAVSYVFFVFFFFFLNKKIKIHVKDNWPSCNKTYIKFKRILNLNMKF